MDFHKNAQTVFWSREELAMRAMEHGSTLAADGGFTAASWPGAAAGRNQSERRGELRERCPRNRFTLRQFIFFWLRQRSRPGAPNRLAPEGMQIKIAAAANGCILPSPRKQNGNPG